MEGNLKSRSAMKNWSKIDIKKEMRECDQGEKMVEEESISIHNWNRKPGKNIWQ